MLTFKDIERKKLRKLLEEFDKAAISWGWTEDQGSTQEEVDKADALYISTKHELVQYVRNLRLETLREV